MEAKTSEKRLYLLKNLRVGDVIHANSSRNTASLICLIYEISDGYLYTRRVTTQDEVKFNIDTGLGIDEEDGAVFTIDSIEPLPVDMHKAMLRIDRVHRLVEQKEKSALTEDDKKAILFVVRFYPKHPL